LGVLVVRFYAVPSRFINALSLCLLVWGFIVNHEWWHMNNKQCLAICIILFLASLAITDFGIRNIVFEADFYRLEHYNPKNTQDYNKIAIDPAWLAYQSKMQVKAGLLLYILFFINLAVYVTVLLRTKEERDNTRKKLVKKRRR
jgi:uncharacterized membrane protein YbhN (UPF0104 family)